MRRFVILVLSLALFGCYGRVSEPEGCPPARDRLKEFYSIRLDAEMRDVMNLTQEEIDFLTKPLIERLNANPDPDYFIPGNRVPNSFRIGKCKAQNSGFSLDVILFWKVGEEKSQRVVKASMIKESGEWKLNSVN